MKRFLPVLLLISLSALGDDLTGKVAALQTTLELPSGSTDTWERGMLKAADGRSLPFRLLRPSGTGDAKVPLVLFLHGAGERGADNEAQLKHAVPLWARPENRAKYPCYVIAPQCPKEEKWADINWSAPGIEQPAAASSSGELAVALAEAMRRDFPRIDSDRLYITGISMGGYGTWDLIMREPQRWAAAVPVCGGGDPRVVAKAKGVPVWIFHGDLDQPVPVERSRELVAALREAGSHPLYSEYPGVKHNSWDNAYTEPDLLPWMWAQRRGGPAVEFAKVAAPFAQPPSSEFPGAGPVQPGIWFRDLWKTRRSEWGAAVAADKGAVVFLGDSITQGWNTLAQDFPGVKVANRGISGDTTRGVRQRLREDVLAVQPRAVVMLIGTNDIGLGATPETVAENVGAIVKDLRASNAAMTIVLCKVMPASASNGRPADKIRKLNELVDAIAATDPKIVRLDTFTPFADAEGNAKKEEFPDLLHPNAAGYMRWAALLRPVVD